MLAKNPVNGLQTHIYDWRKKLQYWQISDSRFVKKYILFI